MASFNALRESLKQLTEEELYTLKEDIDLHLKKISIDWIDKEYMEEAKKEAKEVSLESVRKSLSKIEGSVSDSIISSREDRF